MTGEGLGALVVLGVLVGLDNLQVGAGLGLLDMSSRNRWAFAGSFALAETAMPLLGLVGGRGVAAVAGEWGDLVGVAMLALTGALIFASARLGKLAGAARGGSWPMVSARIALPISLSFDNLFAGSGLGALGFPVLGSALVIGAASGGLCVLGLFGGARLRRFVPRRAEMLSGGYLLLLATFRLIQIGA